MDQVPTPTTLVTHGESAWLADIAPLATVVVVLLFVALVGRGWLNDALTLYLMRRFNPHAATNDPALVWHPPIIGAERLLMICILAVLLMLAALSMIAPLFLAALLSGPLTALLIWLLLWVEEQSYVRELDAALTMTVGRLEAQLRAGSGIQSAMRAVMVDLPESPLKAEWTWFLDRLGVPLQSQTLATAPVVCAALLTQTPSRRHAALLSHLEIALEQPHSALVRRIGAAYDALQASQRRRSKAKTDLAQMRNTGIVMFLASALIALYLIIAQAERVSRAYDGSLGLVAGLVFGGVVVSPLLAGFLLARVEDVDY